MRKLGAVVTGLALVVAGGVVGACADRQVDPPGAPDGTSGRPGDEGAGGAGASPGGSGGSGTAGAGGSATKPRLVESGSRLEAIVYRGADGSQHPTGRWFDVQRNEECTFRPAIDGQIRCLPDAPTFAPTPNLFADRFCGVQAALVSTACDAAPAYISLPQEGACSPPKLMRPGTVINPGAAAYKLTPGVSCAEQQVLPGTVVFAVGDEAPAADFVAATVERLKP